MLGSRFAPTPSGYLHAGNGFNFLLVWCLVRKSGGEIRLRIDDQDSLRMQDRYLDDIFETLQWLQLDWDLGPQSVTEFKQSFSGIYRQSQYFNMLQRLIDTGYVYACHCSRKEMALYNSSGIACPCRQHIKPLHYYEPGVNLRFFIPENSVVGLNDFFLGTECFAINQPDPVVWRKEGIPAYHLATITDDFEYKTNLIVRGSDLREASVLQAFLAKTLGLSDYLSIRYVHHPLIMDSSGNKLSKSTGSTSLNFFRESGLGPGVFLKTLQKSLGNQTEWGMLDAYINKLGNPLDTI
jgi:glutamyl/glutaminyl-tRNA synthetase